MYALESNIVGQPIMSLQTGQIVAWVGEPILNIANLEIVAFACQDSGRASTVLLASDIRQYATDCLIINDEDELAEPDDIVRLSEQLRLRYTPLGKRVYTDTGRKVGTVEDYSFNLETCRLQKLFVKPPFPRGLISSTLTLDRMQITDITPDRIVVRDTTDPLLLLAPEQVPDVNT